MLDEFFNAIKKGDDAKVGEMLDENSDLANARDQQGLSPVTIATYYNRSGIADALILRGAELDVHEASMTGKLQVVRNLLASHRYKVDSLSRDGFSALHLASFFGHREIVQYLLTNGADVNVLANNATKVRPLHSAVAHNHFEISKALIDHGADVNARQQGGFTPLHEAAFGGSVDVAALLLEHGADTDARTDSGKTPLELTAEESPEAGPKQDREKVARLLTEKDAH